MAPSPVDGSAGHPRCESLEPLQLNLVRSHAAGVGDALPVRAIRALLLLRANVLPGGFSGTRLETLQALVDLLNRCGRDRARRGARTFELTRRVRLHNV
jgi:hypothetical protein